MLLPSFGEANLNFLLCRSLEYLIVLCVLDGIWIESNDSVTEEVRMKVRLICRTWVQQAHCSEMLSSLFPNSNAGASKPLLLWCSLNWWSECIVAQHPTGGADITPCVPRLAYPCNLMREAKHLSMWKVPLRSVGLHQYLSALLHWAWESLRQWVRRNAFGRHTKELRPSPAQYPHLWLSGCSYCLTSPNLSVEECHPGVNISVTSHEQDTSTFSISLQYPHC